MIVLSSTLTELLIINLKIFLKMSIYLFFISFLLILPMAVDGTMQEIDCNYNSSNLKRAITGTLFGIGITIIIEALL